MRRIVIPMALAAVVAMSAHRARATEADDKAAAAQVAAIMRDSGKLKNYSVGVKYKDGTVWLAGKVTSPEQMSTALQLVSDVDGVEQIVNNMTIAPAAAQPAAARPSGAVNRSAKPTPVGSPVRQAGGAEAATAANNSNVQLAAAAQAQAKAKGQVQQAGGHRAKAGYRQLAAPVAAGPVEEVGGPVGRGGPIPAYAQGVGGAVAPAAYDHPHMPNYAWPSYAAYPNYAALTYPKQYSASAFPFIGPFYPYPQVPLGWRKVSLEWDDGWWFLDFDDRSHY